MNKDMSISGGRQQLLNRMLQQKRAGARKTTIPARTAVGNIEHNIAPLSYVQQRMYFFEQFESDSTVYSILAACEVNGALNISSLEKALYQIVERHQILRTTFRQVDDELCQCISGDIEANIAVVDIRAYSGEQQQDHLDGLFSGYLAEPFDLGQGPLFKVTVVRLNETKNIICLNIHHAIFDGVSGSVFFKELMLFYKGVEYSEVVNIDPLPIQYADYAHWQQTEQAGMLEQQLEYWKGRLSGQLPVLQLPIDNVRPESQTFTGAHHSFTIPADLSEAIKQLARKQKVSLFMLLLAAFKLLLARYSGQTDIIVGTPIAGRNYAEVQSLIGCFVNTLVLRTDIAECEYFTDVLEVVKRVSSEAFARQDYPFDRLVDELMPQRDLRYSPIFQVMFTVNIFQDQSDIDLMGLDFKPLEISPSVSPFDLTVDITESASGSELVVGFTYNKDLFKEETINQIGRHYQNLLRSIVIQPAAHCADLVMLGTQERLNLFTEWNKTSGGVCRCIHEIFEEQVEATPDQLALAYNGNEVTYRELNKQSNRLAHYLIECGVGDETLVGLCMERSTDMIVSILAVLKAGGAYVPLDPEYPQSRLSYMIEDSGVEVMLCHSASVPDGKYAFRAIALDDVDIVQALHDFSSHNLANVQQGPNSLAYIMYTSGSTGQPKGTMVEHQSISRLVKNPNYITFNRADKVAQASNCSFDAATFEIFGALLNGASLCFIEPEVLLAPERLEYVLKQEFITTLFITTALFNQMSVENPAGFSSLKYLLFGGEKVNIDAVNRIVKSGKPAHLVHVYGPTENTTFSTYYEIRVAADQFPIGKPISATSCFVLDRNKNILPRGGVGELYLGGSGLARGYYKKPELTQEAFIANPFANDPGARLYKTGDLVRYCADGNLEFIGRVDDQVKIRGFRIELGEIEYQLRSLAEIDSAVVLVKENESESKHLVAYFTTAVAATDQNIVQTVRQKLKKSLPEHMMPSFFVCLEQFPVNANGKIDKEALPEPDTTAAMGEYKPAVTESEIKLLEIWSRLLKIDKEKISVTANFFELGGDSILSIQVVSNAAKAGLHITVKQIFEHQTIQNLALHLKAGASIKAPQHAISGEQGLLPIQHAFFEDDVDMHHFNQSVMLSAPADFNLSTLNEVVEQLYRRHDVLRLRFARSKTGKGSAYYAEYDVAMLAETVHLVETESLEGEALTDKATELQQSLSITDGPLFRAIYFRGVDENGRLLLIMHHLIVDGVSWRVILDDINALCAQIRQGDVLSLPAKTASFQQWGGFLQEYADSPELHSEKAYWLESLLKDVPQLQAAVANTAEQLQREDQEIRIELDDILTQQLLQQAGQAYRTQINELLLAALLLGFSKWKGQTAIRVDLEGHGREELSSDLDLSQTVGWFTTVYPLTLSAKKVDDLAELICNVKEQYRSVPNKGLGYGVLKYLAKDPELIDLSEKAGSEIVFNYLGQFDQNVNSVTYFKGAAESTGINMSPRRKQTHKLSFNGLVTGGCLRFDLSFDAAAFEYTDMQHLSKAIHQALKDVVSHCLQPGNKRLTASDFPLSKIENKELSLWQQQYSILDIYPATPMQRGLLFHSAMDRSAYVTQMLLAIEGKLDVELFENAWLEVVKRHDIFRTAFVSGNNGMQQLVLSSAELAFTSIDLSRLNRVEQDARIASDQSVDKANGFNTSQAPLMRLTLWRLSEDEYRFLWTVHHALVDGWCLPLVYNDVFQCYWSQLNKQPLSLPKPSPYRDYVSWLLGKQQQISLEYWRKEFHGVDGATPLPRRKNQAALGIEEVSLEFTPDETAALSELVRVAQCTMNILVQAAWATLLSYYSDTETVVFGATVSGRPAELANAESMVGLFINTVPVRADIPTEVTVLDWLQSLHRRFVELNEHSYVSLVDIQKEIGLPGDASLFDSLVIFENYPVDETVSHKVDDSGLKVNMVGGSDQTNYALTLVATHGKHLNIGISYQRSEFDAEIINRLKKHIKTILLSMAAEPSRGVGDIALLDQQEKHHLYHVLNDTKTKYQDSQCMHQLFEKQATLTPDATAAIYEGESLTYAQLNECANRLAHYLMGQGVSPDSLVAVSMERSLDMLIAVLAIFKSGAAYLPLDPAYPASRLEYMVQDSGVRILLSQGAVETVFYKTQGVQRILLDDHDLQTALAGMPSTNPEVSELTVQRLAYVIYTSGSTGKPKGVMIEHRNLINFLFAMKEKPGLDTTDTLLAVTSLSFDIHTLELYLPLICGAKIIIASKEATISPDLLSDLIGQHQVSVMQATPATWQMLVNNNWQAPAGFKALCGGEALSMTLKEKLLSGNEAELWNMYGPTETSVWSSVKLIKKQDARVDIGPPIANTQFYILDKKKRLSPLGVIGELYIGGDGLARGYLNRSELTAERFIENPFSTAASGRIYKTGDLVRWLDNGDLEFVGRADYQVKLRGFRIELGEIEALLLKSTLVKEAVVVVNEKAQQLFAYVVASDNMLDETTLSERLRAELSESLPPYMVPADTIKLDSMPLTPNGKLDRKALPLPEYPRNEELEISLTATEQELCKICCDILEIDNISVLNNFFYVGGNSLSAVTLLNNVTASLGVNIELTDIFQASSIRELASAVDVKKEQTAKIQNLSTVTEKQSVKVSI